MTFICIFRTTLRTYAKILFDLLLFEYKSIISLVRHGGLDPPSLVRHGGL
ncbi:MAG: hypothetical protein V1781_09860 [Bacteroidota bacterium]